MTTGLPRVGRRLNCEDLLLACEGRPVVLTAGRFSLPSVMPAERHIVLHPVFKQVSPVRAEYVDGLLERHRAFERAVT